MQKKSRGKHISCVAVFEIALMISMSFAFSFLLSDNVGLVSADTLPSMNEYYSNPSGLPAASGAGSSITRDLVTKDIIFKQPAGIKIGTQEVSEIIQRNGQYYAKTATSEIKLTGEQLNTLKSADIGANLKAASGAKEYNVLPGWKTVNPLVGHLAQGVFWAVAVVGVVQLVGNLAGFDKGLTNSLSYALGAGIFGGKALMGVMTKWPTGGVSKALTFGGKFTAGQSAFAAGALIAAVVFILTYKNEKKQLVKFECLPWEPPIGGASCETCNNDPFRPCSEYRCKSLGQACQLLNAGTAKEQCTWVSKFDVESPKITPWTDALRPTDAKYIPDTSVRPPALGVKVVSPSQSGCLEAFTPLQFGFITNEPAQCKIDYNHTSNFDAMNYFVGGDNYYSYNHTQIMRLPGPDGGTQGELAPLLQNDGAFALYVRCRDANGNFNVDEYSVSFCVDQGPDTTPPRIERTSIVSGSAVQYNIDQVPIEVYTNEPSDCRWSTQSKAYDDMENSMVCASKSYQLSDDLLYPCLGNVTGVKNNEPNTYYFRCKDQPGKVDSERNVMVQSYEFKLEGSQPLVIDLVGPNETVSGSTSAVNVSLEVFTSNGAEEGKAICSFSEDGTLNSYISMFETQSHMHRQILHLSNGTYKYYFRCVDSGGNLASATTNFSVSVDKSAPRVTRVYRDQALKIVTDEDAECRYSLTTCNFNTDEGLRMEYASSDNHNVQFADWKSGASYYIRCKDVYGNEPNPATCSVIARPTQLTQEGSITAASSNPFDF